MPTARPDANILPNVIYLSRDDAKAIVPMLEHVKSGQIDELRITDGSQTLYVRKGAKSSQSSFLSRTIADTTLSQNITINVNGHTLIRFLNALRGWGDAVTSFTFEADNQTTFYPTIRFLMAAGS